MVFAVAMWLVFRTLRLQIITAAPESNPYTSDNHERFLYSVWHDSAVIPTFAGKHQRTTALTSQHSDGSFVAEVLKLNRIASIRGSTSRISTVALRKLIAQAESNHVVITPDGPRGPNRRMSIGIAFIAAKTGKAIVPTAYACSRCWKWKGSWSDLIIPKPFAKVVLLAGAPIHVAADLTTLQLRNQTERIQVAMDDLHEAAERELCHASMPSIKGNIIRGSNFDVR